MSQEFIYFGKYILLEKMAAGGMAEVFLSRAPGAGGIGKYVAIKRILPQFSDNKEFIDMFKDEAKIAINLSHSNIVSIYEFGVENGAFFLVMEYVKGCNIRQILNKLKQTEMNFSVDQIVYMCKEIAGGLDHAHRCLDGSTGKPLNITHRDMSPQNVMVSYEGEIKIIDFGIAKAEIQVENTRAGTLKGKFGYMSPEQADGQPVDLRTDIFSLGTVLWELLANERLFLANNEINTLKKIRDCNIPSLVKLNPDVHPELERICLKALTKDRNLRYQTAAAFHRDLSRFLNRHYPDFSPHDFSMFIKSLYADEILDLNNRLVEFSKIPFREPMPTHTEPRKKFDEITSFSEMNKKALKKDGAPSGLLIKDQKIKEETIKEKARSPEELPEPDAQAQAEQNRNRQVNEPNVPSGNTSKYNLGGNLNTKKKSKSLDGVGTGEEAAAFNLEEDLDGLQAPLPDHPNVNRKVKGPSKSKVISDTATGTVGFKKPRGVGLQKTVMFLIYATLIPFSYLILASFLESSMKGLIKNVNIAMYDLGVCDGFESSNVKNYIKQVGLNPNALCNPDLPRPNPIETVCSSPLVLQDSECRPCPPASEYDGKGGCTTKQASGNPTDPKPDPTPLQPPDKLNLNINSDPSGAEIYFNGEFTRRTTPAIVQVPANKELNIELRKSRYETYKIKSVVPADLDSRTIDAKMKRIEIAYLDIDVQPPRAIVITIDGKKIKKPLPIVRHAIPANKRVVVQAESQVTRRKASETVVLRKGERKVIVLKLRRRSPAGN